MTSSQSLQHSTISASKLEGRVTVTKPVIEFRQILQTWLQNQDKHWPREQLTADVLSNNIVCNYLDNWILDGNASGNWSASIGTTQQKISTCNNCYGKGGWYDMWKEWHKCPTCGTSGKVVENFTSWHSQSGIASGEINGKVIENITGGVNIRCGKRDLKAKELLFSPTELSSIQVFQPKSIDEETGRKIAEDIIHDNLHRDANHSASRLGSVRDLKVGYVRFEKINARHWLYPIFMGSYNFEEKRHTIQIDGVTGNLFIEIPESVRSARWNETMKLVASVIGFIAVLFLIFYGMSALVNLFTK